MAAIAVQKGTLVGTVVARQAAVGGGDTLPNDGHTYLEVENPTENPISVTISRVKPCNQGTTHNVTVAVPASEVKSIGPFPREEFGSEAAVTYTGAGLNVRGHH